jgi:hypothetical protein
MHRRTEEEAKKVRARKKGRAMEVRECCILVGVYYFGSN